MRLDSLTIRDFRNIGSLDVDIPPEGVVIIGDNGQGKTSFLEAAFYLVLFRSLRGSRDRELVRFGTGGFFVAGQAKERVQAGYEVSGRRKKVVVNGKPVVRLGEAVGTFTAVPFAPRDRTIVTGAPGERRRFLDVLLSLGDAAYLRGLSDLKMALRQRNAALRRGRAGEAAAFDAPMAQAAEQVIRVRRDWVAEWQTRYSEICGALGQPGDSRLEYSPRRDEPETLEMILAELAVTIDRDLANGSTSHGPHRHDLRFTLDGKELRSYGSSGQQGTAAIALRILESEVLRERTGRQPVALYDDIFAELDRTRQGLLLERIREQSEGQVIMTAPRDSEVPKEMFDRPRWTIKGGRIEV